MKNFALSTLEKTLNRYLALDPDSSTLLAPLKNRVMGLHIKHPKITIYFIFQEEKIQLTNEKPEKIDTEIFTTLFQLMRLKWQTSKSLVNSQMYVQGDVDTAQRFHELFEKHHIDWEDNLSKLVGDVTAHKMMQLLKKPTDFFKRNKSKFTQDCAEYAQEEAGWLPSKYEVDGFYREVDELRLQVDRLQAKMESLKKR